MNKLDTVRAFLSDREAALIITPVGRRYLTGFDSTLGYLLVTKQDAFLLMDGRYFEAASRKAAADCQVVELTRLSAQLKEYVQKLGLVSVLVETEITVRLLNTISSMLEEVSVLPSQNLSDLLTEMRQVKSDGEVEKIKAAQSIAEQAFDYILGFIRPGVTEREIALTLDFQMRSLGADDISFETIAVSGKNSSMPHGVPGSRAVRAGDFITMDFGALVDGYHSDMTRTVAVGFVTDEMRLVYNTVLKSQQTALSSVQPGKTGESVDRAARDVIDAAGFGDYFNHSAGHGVGLEIHEELRFSRGCKTRLVPGNVMTVEPGIYLPGKFGVRIEDMVLVTVSGCENLTHSEKKLIIL